MHTTFPTRILLIELPNRESVTSHSLPSSYRNGGKKINIKVFLRLGAPSSTFAVNARIFTDVEITGASSYSHSTSHKKKGFGISIHPSISIQRSINPISSVYRPPGIFPVRSTLP